MNTKITLILFCIIIHLLSSCTGCDPTSLSDGSNFGFRILNESTDENIFTRRYSIEEFQILDEQKDTINIDSYRYTNDGDFTLGVNPTTGQPYILNQENQRLFFLQFDSLDTDTLTLSFIPRNGDCGEYMDDFKAYYNEKLVFEGSKRSSYGATFSKK